MKLNSIQPVGPMAPTIPAGGVGKSGEGASSFDEILNRAAQAGPGPAGPASTVPAAAPLGEIRATMPPITPMMPSPAAERTVALLSLLEVYSHKMESVDVPLKEIESLVGELGALATELTASLGDEPDARIRELAEQSATLAGIESVKFRRGDYL